MRFWVCLKDEIYGELTDNQKELISIVEKSGNHLLDLINDILDLAKIESGKLELHIANASVNTICNTSTAFVKQLALRKRISLSVDIEPNLGLINVDERRIQQALINLLSNAVKFTPENGWVKLRVFTVSRNEPPLYVEQECIAFEVEDNGIGIASEDHGRLFQSFVQIDSSLSRHHAGTGLGLALVRRILEMHNGTVELVSDLGKGSCFRMILPVQPVPSNSNNSDLIYNKVLIITEDHNTEDDHLTKILMELGIRCVVCSLQEDIYLSALRGSPDLILIDVTSAPTVAWRLMDRLQQFPQTKDIPVGVVGNLTHPSLAYEHGATLYFPKPVSRETLLYAFQRMQSNQTHRANQLRKGEKFVTENNLESITKSNGQITEPAITQSSSKIPVPTSAPTPVLRHSQLSQSTSSRAESNNLSDHNALSHITSANESLNTTVKSFHHPSKVLGNGGVSSHLVLDVMEQNLGQPVSHRTNQVVDNHDSHISSNPPKQPLLLVVEDSQDNIDTVVPYLTAKGFQIIVSDNGQDCLVKAEMHQPSLILMDIQMPQMDGFTAIRHLRANPLTKKIPIIAVTALAMQGDRERCLLAGADDYIAKPIRLKYLVEMLHWHLSEKQS